jgi:hypothetical protein
MLRRGPSGHGSRPVGDGTGIGGPEHRPRGRTRKRERSRIVNHGRRAGSAWTPVENSRSWQGPSNAYFEGPFALTGPAHEAPRDAAAACLPQAAWRWPPAAVCMRLPATARHRLPAAAYPPPQECRWEASDRCDFGPLSCASAVLIPPRGAQFLHRFCPHPGG